MKIHSVIQYLLKLADLQSKKGTSFNIVSFHLEHYLFDQYQNWSVQRPLSVIGKWGSRYLCLLLCGAKANTDNLCSAIQGYYKNIRNKLRKLVVWLSINFWTIFWSILWTILWTTFCTIFWTIFWWFFWTLFCTWDHSSITAACFGLF